MFRAAEVAKETLKVASFPTVSGGVVGVRLFAILLTAAVVEAANGLASLGGTRIGDYSSR